jgi:hypothetical protein
MSTYEIEGMTYPRVTAMLPSPDLKQWAVNMACNYMRDQLEELSLDKDITENLYEIVMEAQKKWKDISKEALDIGSKIHALIEEYIKTGNDLVDYNELDQVENGFKAFLEWEEENIEEWTESERTVHDPDLGYAGTLDACAKLKDGRYVVIDFKSSKGFYPEYAMQIAAYRAAYEKEMNVKMDGMLIVRLDKTTGMPEVKDYSKVYEDKYKAFVCLVDYYYAAAKRRVKNKRTAK